MYSPGCNYDELALKVSRRVMLEAMLFCAATIATISFPLATTVAAVPVTYVGFAITDGQLGRWQFHNARVYFVFIGNTDTVQFIQPYIDPNNPQYGTVDVWINQSGLAMVFIAADDRTVAARFARNQLFVSVDLGDTVDAPHLGARGMGFGSVTSTGFEPAYPLGVEDGTIDWGDIGNDPSTGATASPELIQSSKTSRHVIRKMLAAQTTVRRYEI